MAGELSRVLGALAQPARTLPEGPEGLPTTLVMASGGSDPLPERVGALRTALPPLLGHDLRQAISFRANAAFAAPPAPQAVVAMADLSVARGWGLSTVGELLAEAGRRAEARRAQWPEVEDVGLPTDPPKGSRECPKFASVLLDVLRGARGATSLSTLKPILAARCEEEGLRLPSQARFWRHLVRLERLGIVSRDVRLGGRGGSQTVVALRNQRVRSVPSSS